MPFHIRELTVKDLNEALSLAWSVFEKFEAPEYTQEGIEEFRKSIYDESFLSKLRFYGAFIQDTLAGIIAVRNEGNHIALFFVAPEYHRQGIGRQLFQTVLEKYHPEKVTVNSSPFAVSVYRRLGFCETNKEQVVNGLRFTPMEFTPIRRIDEQNRSRINDFIKEHWYSLEMVVRGETINMGNVEGFFTENDEHISGLITFRAFETALEILSLDSVFERQGIGTRLLEAVVREAKRLSCDRIVLITTNDNLNALRFYQKRGFDLLHLYRNAVDDARKIKPDIPLSGNDSIPLHHEIELERRL